MDRVERHPRLRRRRTAWLAGAAVLLVLGAGLLATGSVERHRPLAGPVALHPSTGQATRSDTSPVTTPSATLQVARSVPVGLSIPALGLTVSLTTLGLNPDGTVQVPGDAVHPGWFRLGPTPGQIGSSVILGHVDSTAGPGVFFGLRNLTAGDRIDVSLADGGHVEFEVTSVASYLKSVFPAQAVYGSTGHSALQLVTCGGAFDSGTGSYLSNVVVYSSLVAYS